MALDVEDAAFWLPKGVRYALLVQALVSFRGTHDSSTVTPVSSGG
jgi:hypothetical protein